MIRRALLFALIWMFVACASVTGPRDEARQRDDGEWIVRLADGSSCSLWPADATTPDGAIARCRDALAMVPR